MGVKSVFQHRGIGHRRMVENNKISVGGGTEYRR